MLQQEGGTNCYSSTWRGIKKSVQDGRGTAKTQTERRDEKIGGQTSRNSKSNQARDFIKEYCETECDTVPIAVGSNSVAYVLPFDKVLYFVSANILAFF